MRTIVKYGLCCLFVAGLAISFDLSPISAQIFNGYRKGVQIANLEGSDATISIIGYQEDGSVESLAIDTIPANGSKTYAGVRAFPGDFSGSIMVASSTKVAGLVNILDTSRNVYGSYMGRNTGSTTVSLPLLFSDFEGYFTWYSVQNVGSASTTVNISYSDEATNSAEIQPGAAKFFYQEDETGHTRQKFAATITSDQPIVAAVVQEREVIIVDEDGEPDPRRVLLSYTGFSEGTTHPVFPLVQQNNPAPPDPGYRTGIQIQNLSDTTPTIVAVGYTPGTYGTYCEEEWEIEPGESKTFGAPVFQRPYGRSDCTIGQRFVGSARVISNSEEQPLVAVVNQVRNSRNGGAYGSMNPAKATHKVSLPLIMDRRSGFNTGIAVQHVAGPAANVECTFSNAPSTSIINRALSVDGSFTAGQRGQIADGYAGSGLCTADNSETKIIAVVNQVKRSEMQDLLLVYEGIPVQ